jgi:DNA-binding winged helix-turn-helix (wHTH) protein
MRDMSRPATAPPVVKLRFGAYEVDSGAGELRKNGLRIRIQKQPFQILIALLQKAGEIVTREELRLAIWGDDTIVDFEHGLNAAVNKLRQALSDSSEQPRYIETIPGTGYRLLGAVQPIPAAAIENHISSPLSIDDRSTVPRGAVGATVATAALIIAGFLCGWFLRSPPGASPSRLVQVTSPLPDGFWTELAGTRQDFAISPDGSKLAFVASDALKSQLWLRALSELTTRPVAPDHNVRGLVWAPESRSLYFDERNMVRQISIDGEVVRTIGELPLRSPWMGLLRTGDELTLYTRAGTFVLPASGGTPRRIDDAAYRWTEPLPGNFPPKRSLRNRDRPVSRVGIQSQESPR